MGFEITKHHTLLCWGLQSSIGKLIMFRTGTLLQEYVKSINAEQVPTVAMGWAAVCNVIAQRATVRQVGNRLGACRLTCGFMADGSRGPISRPHGTGFTRARSSTGNTPRTLQVGEGYGVETNAKGEPGK